jgi:crotonobetainyl-CoA:carnitine CoA-transferase CaiB-like acyl-CoA transferase
MANGPLRNIKILDLTHVWAGPLATRILADLGAEVVKIEAPMGRGPRFYGGVPIGGFIGREPGEEPYNNNAAFVKLQRNKKSVVIDLKSQDGRQVFLDLVAKSDVVIENFSARAMTDLELDYRHLQKANPQVIHVAMPGFGLTGPYSKRVAFGPTVEPMSGLTRVMGYSAHELRSTAMALPDPIAALHAVSAVLTAIQKRARTGVGELVEMSLHESVVSAHGAWIVDAQLGSENLTPHGNRHPEMVPHGVYSCKGVDEWVAIACRNDEDWRSLCKSMGEDQDAQLTLAHRRTMIEEIDKKISSWCIERPPEKVVHTLQDNRVPAGHVRRTPEMTSDPHVQFREFFVPLEKDTPIPGNPIKMKTISPVDWTPCPCLGEHNEAILKDWLGFNDVQIANLKQLKVIVDKPPR